MSDILKPEDATQLQDCVAWALDHSTPLMLRAGGSKLDMGRTERPETTLDLSTLTGITLYEPEELVLSARAGTPVAEIEALLANNNQELAFEPMNYGPLLGSDPNAATLGGMISVNACGPRRMKVGSARDHILGVSAVSGRAETFKSGGRVVKNVTGYDLSKAVTGAWGTLAAISDITVKVLPKAETSCTLVVDDVNTPDAVALFTKLLNTPAEISGAAYIQSAMAEALGLQTPKSEGAIVIRLEGFKPSVDYRVGMVEKSLGTDHTLERVDGRSEALWKAIRDVRWFDPTKANLWRISITPNHSADFLKSLSEQMACEAMLDWGGGLVWLSVPNSLQEAGSAMIRDQLANHGGGHATLIAAPRDIRSRVDAFQPQPDGLAALSKRLKQQFDPKGILNPLRMNSDW